MAAFSNLFFEHKLRGTNEVIRMFNYIERKEALKFKSIAKSSNLNLAELRNKNGQSLMHVAAMVGDMDIARYLKHAHCTGYNKDVSS